MKRRDFLQLTGFSTASALLAGCRQSNEKLIPFLVAPDDGIVPGKADHYASVCRQCPAGCGILVRVSEGRAKKIEGNPRHPVNLGRLCARGQAGLQELYHPDRIRQPLKRSGPRGSGRFEPISWEEALGTLASVLDAASDTGGITLMTPPLNGALAEVVERFLEARNLPPESHLPWDLLHPEWQVESMRDSYGVATLPEYDVEKTQYLISFGADFAETFLSPVHYGDAFGKMRQARPTVRGRFAYVGGRLSQTAGSADRWLPVRPGTEGEVALCIAREVLARGRHDERALRSAGVDLGRLEDLLEPYTAGAVAKSSDVPLSDVEATAHDFATIRPAVAMAGNMSAWQTNGEGTIRAVQLLNLMVGNLGREGGVSPVPREAVGHSSYRRLLEQIERMQAGKVSAALVYGVNPVYSVPKALGMRKALEEVPFVASFASLLDDTARQADLILPDHAALESWGEISPAAGIRRPVVGLMQPVVRPLHDTRAFGDVLLALGRDAGAGGKKLLPWSDMPQMLKDRARRRLGMAKGTAFETKWVALLQAGGMFDLPPENSPGKRFGQGTDVLPQPAAARFVGKEKEFSLHLQVYPSPAFSEGRGAALPWLQQMPDPMSTVVWGAWVEINPQTAAQRGIRHGDLVEVQSPQGRLKLPAVVYPGIRPDLVAIPMGQGHDGMGRYADGRGANPLNLLAAAESVAGRLPAWGATRVAVRRVGKEGDLVTAGHPEGSYRRELLGF